MPIGFSGKKVTSLLLVPVIGACIHLPPPPPNQVVHVIYPKGIEIQTFDAVTVVGSMSVEQGTEEVFLIDGISGVDFSYRVTAQDVVPFYQD